MYNKGRKELDQDIIEIKEEIEQVEQEIRMGLVSQIQSVTSIIDHGLDCVARLDVLFSKAAFAKRVNGIIPQVGNEGKVDVTNFVHPILLNRVIDNTASNTGKNNNNESTLSLESNMGLANTCTKKSNASLSVVPINLHLSSDAGERALIISGPNGGGKTISMKSFGLVCILCNLGIPIPVSSVLPSPSQPRVDFFNNIFVDAGDRQSVVEGESTWTAKINACASIIDQVRNRDTSQTSIVLLDELGGGTDPEAGGAIAQAVLENLIKVDQCRIIATTHSPRLKALSYEDSDFGCATMLLQRDESEAYQMPTFCLEYGLIGESCALGAASRSKPTLPEDVLNRATELMSSNDSESGNGSYMRALSSSLEKQVGMANQAKDEANKAAIDVARCRKAMMSLAAAYDGQLAQLEKKIENCYQQLLKAAEKEKLDDLTIVGATLSELRVVQKQVKSQKDILAERGLKALQDSCELKVGDSVVIIAPGEWDGTSAHVVGTSVEYSNLAATQVYVEPTSSFGMFDDSGLGSGPLNDRPLMFQRHELAVWAYDATWDYDDVDVTASVTSVANSKRQLTSLLSNLKSSDPPFSKTVNSKQNRSKSVSRTKKAFTSSRERRAANKKNKKRRK